MRWILDANTIIYLIKTNLDEVFTNLAAHDIVIDTSVYEEVVEKGLEKGYDDAKKAKTFLEKNKIPIIPINITNKLQIFKDPGETSCFILSEDDGICITSDSRAIKKFEKKKSKAIQLDSFFFLKTLDGNITKNQFESILNGLEKVFATTPERISVYLNKLKEVELDE